MVVVAYGRQQNGDDEGVWAKEVTRVKVDKLNPNKQINHRAFELRPAFIAHNAQTTAFPPGRWVAGCKLN